MQKEIGRLLDANFNRSREGLRVCEDIARFILNSPSLTKELKAMRHNISDVLKKTDLCASLKKLSLSRDVAGDVGKATNLKSEMARKDCYEIFTANIERVKESLRVIEEFLKLADTSVSAEVSLLRFKVYDIEKRSVKKISSLRNIR